MNSEFAIAVHALVFLYHNKTTMTSEQISQNVCTNPARLRKVMGKLKAAKLITTKEGANGGYHLIKDANEINLKNISDALSLNMIQSSWKSGGIDMECFIAKGMAGLMDQIYTDLDDLCKNRLKEITLLNIEEELFNRNQC